METNLVWPNRVLSCPEIAPTIRSGPLWGIKTYWSPESCRGLLALGANVRSVCGSCPTCLPAET
eukprot:9613521-Lingulodinium_polyedra.AAC.1